MPDKRRLEVVHVNHGYSNEFLNSHKTANVYFTSDVDAKNRIRSLNEFSKIILNAIRRAGMHDDGVFNDCQLSDQEFNDEIASIVLLILILLIVDS